MSDDATMCVRRQWQGDDYPYDVINTQSFRKVEHVVPDYASGADGYFYVNRFAFIHQRRGF